MLTHPLVRSTLLIMSFCATALITGCTAHSPRAATPTHDPGESASRSHTTNSSPSSTARGSSPASQGGNATPQSTAETWLHALGSNDFATVCKLYNPDGQLFQAFGGMAGCVQRFSGGPKPNLGAQLTHAVVNPNAITTQGETATIPLSAVTIDGKPWSNNISGNFMTLAHGANGWQIPDAPDATVVTAPGSHP